MEDNCLMGHGSFSPLFSSLVGHRTSLFDKGVHPLLHRPAAAADLPPACGFMELLGHHQKFEGLSSVLDGVSHEMMNPSVTTTTSNTIGDGSSSGLLEASEVSNPFPATPNSSSISSASNDDAKEEQLEDQDLHPHDKTCTKQPLKPKKTNQNQKKKKKQRESRIAFMTKSEVDHLEDGYRWRKYGQKAVKNSHFPRSYYRCTNAACNVKKRVERCLTDPSMVITTYEGQHTHPSPIAPHNIGFPTGFLPNSGFCGGISTTPTNAATLPPQMSSNAPTNLSSYMLHDNYVNGCFPGLTFNQSSSSSTTTTSTKFQSYFVHGSRRFCNPSSDGVDLPRANGLLQDIVPSHLYNAP